MERALNNEQMTIITPDNELECINPATRELITTIPISNESEIEQKIEIIKYGLDAWQALSLTERARHITNVRKHLVAKMDEIIDTLCEETGKTDFDGIIEILTTVEIMRFVAKQGPSALKSQKRRISLLKTKRGYVHYLPYGIVGIISPWNYPMILTVGLVVQALIGGNGVILKPSEYAPLTALKLKEIFDESGFPQELFQVCIGMGDIGEKIIRSPDTKLICFTGSVSVGKKIALACAEQLKPMILELGGKDPMIVLEDSDIERAARAAVWGGMSNCGQTCISVERIFVENSIADQFIEHVIKFTKDVSYGTNRHEHAMGSIINERQAKHILAQIKDALEKDAKIPIGGDDDFSLGGFFIKPTVVVDADNSMKVMTEETFGPVITITRVQDEMEAIKMANSVTYGLNASIFTQNIRKARKIAKSLNVGNICINDVMSNYLCVELPFGGVGFSGIGRLQGIEGLRSFTQIQSVCEDRFGLEKEPWWFPVPDIIKKGFRSLIKIRYG